MTKNIKQKRKNRILAILHQHTSLSNSITWEDLARESGVSFTEIRRIVWKLANHDKILIALNPNPPYGLCIKEIAVE